MSKHEQIGSPNTYQRTKKVSAATLGGLMLFAGVSGNALAKNSRADIAQRPAAARAEHNTPPLKKYFPTWDRAVNVFAHKPQVLNAVIEYPLQKEFPYWYDPWEKTLRVSDIDSPYGGKVDGVIWYPLYKRINGVDVLMFQDKNLPSFGDVPPLESSLDNRYIRVKDLMKFHPTIYYGMDPNLPHIINGSIQTVKTGQTVQSPTSPYPLYPGRYVHAASYSNYQIGRLEGGYVKNGVKDYGLIKPHDQNLEHFIHGH